MKKEQIKSYVSWGKKLEVIFDNGLTMSVAFSDFFCPDDPVDNKDLTVSIKSTKTGMNITGCFFNNVPAEHAYDTESVTIKQKDFIELIKSVKNTPVCVLGNDEQYISKESVEKFVENDEN